MSDTGYTPLLTMPLHIVIMNRDAANHPRLKIGIQVGLMDAANAPQLFEFDTGGPGFWAAYDAQWFPQTTASEPSYAIKYSSNNQYSAVGVNCQVFLNVSSANWSGTLASNNMTVAQIQTANGQPGWPQKWLQDVKAGIGPLDNHFMGDFGADLNSHAAQTAGAPALKSALAQLPAAADLPQALQPQAANARYGFMLDLGDYTSTPRVVPNALGLYMLPQNDANGWNSVPLTQAGGSDGTWTISGTLSITPTLPGLPSIPASPMQINILLDSGAPSTNLKTGKVLQIPAEAQDGGTLKSGYQITLSCGGATLMSWVSGEVPCKNQVSVSVAGDNGENEDGDGYINTGLQGFWNNQIIFMLPGGSPQNGEVWFRNVTNAE